MPHTIKEKKQLLTRVRRIKGQADALETALEQGGDCSAILQQIAWARAQQLPHVYLGYWIDGHAKMDYKARFRPLERLQEGQWRQA